MRMMMWTRELIDQMMRNHCQTTCDCQAKNARTGCQSKNQPLMPCHRGYVLSRFSLHILRKRSSFNKKTKKERPEEGSCSAMPLSSKMINRGDLWQVYASLPRAGWDWPSLALAHDNYLCSYCT